ncbi:MAG: HAD hydrolase family protein [Pseudomonadales bacterium]|nr:HAD hydrolase family protein [Pseudomonadales bacterium]
MQISPKILSLFKPIKLAIFDVDGVFTDGKIYYTSMGQESKAFHTQDGAAIKMLLSTGIQVALITGRHSAMVARRGEELEIPYIYQGIAQKSRALEELASQSGVSPQFMSHTGDDMADLTLFKRVGLRLSVPGAHPEVLARADYVTQTSPGLGAVREICHLIMLAQETWAGVSEHYEQ